MIGSLSPLALPLLALGLMVPLIAHLLARRPSRSLEFPALMLLASRSAGSRRISRTRDALILLLRCLVLVLLALAGTGMYLRGGETRVTGAPAVVILDASASMQQRVGGTSAWELARGTASSLLESFGTRPVMLMIAGTDVQRSGVRPRVGSEAAAAMLGVAKPGYGGGSVTRAVTEAREAIEGRGDIYLVTDLSRSSLSGIDPTSFAETERLHLTRVDAGGENVAITGLSMEPGLAVVGRPVEVMVELANYTDSARDLKVAVTILEERQIRSVRLDPGSRARVVMDLRLDRAGRHVLEATLLTPGADVLEEDDERTGVVEVVEALPVRVFSDLDSTDPRGALKPVLAAFTAAGMPTTLQSGSELAELRPGQDMVVTIGLEGTTDARVLREHMQHGGAWLSFLASSSDADLVRGMPHLGPPIPLDREVDVRDRGRGFVTLSGARMQHPLLRGFVGRENLLHQVEARQYWVTPGEHPTDTEILAAYDDSSTALAVRPVAAGQWVVVNISPHESRSNLASLDVLPLFVSNLADSMLPSRNPRLASDCGTWVSAPEGLETADGEQMMLFEGRARLTRPGAYRTAEGGVVAAAIPPRESDLRVLDDAVIQRLDLAAGSLGAELREAAERPLWPWILLVACALLCFEMLLAPPARSFSVRVRP